MRTFMSLFKRSRALNIFFENQKMNVKDRIEVKKCTLKKIPCEIVDVMPLKLLSQKQFKSFPFFFALI